MIIYRVAHALIATYFKVAYKHKVFGLEHVIMVSKEGCIIAANHTSFLDPPLIGASVPYPVHFLARASLFKGKIFGALIRSLNAVPVTQQIDHRAFKQTQKGFTVVIFPEGSRSQEGEIEPFNLGVALLAKTLDSAVIPAYVGGAYEAWPRQRKFPYFTARTFVAFGSPRRLKDFQAGSASKREQYRAFTAALQEDVEALKKQYSV